MTGIVVVHEAVPVVLELGIAGPQGPNGATGATGATGPQGPQGTPGSAPQAFEFAQAVPAAVWTVAHGLGYRPNVTVIDSTGRVVEGDIAYPDVNTVELTFQGAMSGVVYAS